MEENYKYYIRGNHTRSTEVSRKLADHLKTDLNGNRTYTNGHFSISSLLFYIEETGQNIMMCELDKEDELLKSGYTELHIPFEAFSEYLLQSLTEMKDKEKSKFYAVAGVNPVHTITALKFFEDKDITVKKCKEIIKNLSIKESDFIYLKDDKIIVTDDIEEIQRLHRSGYKEFSFEYPYVHDKIRYFTEKQVYINYKKEYVEDIVRYFIGLGGEVAYPFHANVNDDEAVFYIDCENVILLTLNKDVIKYIRDNYKEIKVDDIIDEKVEPEEYYSNFIHDNIEVIEELKKYKENVYIKYNHKIQDKLIEIFKYFGADISYPAHTMAHEYWYIKNNEIEKTTYKEIIELGEDKHYVTTFVEINDDFRFEIFDTFDLYGNDFYFVNYDRKKRLINNLLLELGFSFKEIEELIEVDDDANVRVYYDKEIKKMIIQINGDISKSKYEIIEEKKPVYIIDVEDSDTIYSALKFYSEIEATKYMNDSMLRYKAMDSNIKIKKLS